MSELTCNELEGLGNAFLIVRHGGQLCVLGDRERKVSQASRAVGAAAVDVRSIPALLRLVLRETAGHVQLPSSENRHLQPRQFRAASLTSLSLLDLHPARLIMRSTQFLGMRPTRALLRPVPVCRQPRRVWVVALTAYG